MPERRRLPVRRIIGGVALVVAGAVAINQYTSKADRDEDGDVVGAGDVDVMSIQVGDCLANTAAAAGEEQLLSSVEAVPCDEPHTAQILARFELTGTTFPGAEAVAASVDEQCPDLVSAALSPASDAYELTVMTM